MTVFRAPSWRVEIEYDKKFRGNKKNSHRRPTHACTLYSSIDQIVSSVNANAPRVSIARLARASRVVHACIGRRSSAARTDQVFDRLTHRERERGKGAPKRPDWGWGVLRGCTSAHLPHGSAHNVTSGEKAREIYWAEPAAHSSHRVVLTLRCSCAVYKLAPGSRLGAACPGECLQRVTPW